MWADYNRPRPRTRPSSSNLSPLYLYESHIFEDEDDYGYVHRLIY